MEAVRRNGRVNPRDTAGPISALLFWWTVRMFRDGSKRDLTPEDMYEPRDIDRSRKLGDALEKQWNRLAAKARGHPSLFRAILRTFTSEYMFLGVLVVINDIVVRLAQPQFLGGLLAYFQPGGGVSWTHALWYAGGVVGCTAVASVCNNHYILGAFHTGMRVRAACCALIYRKALKLSQAALGRTAAGQMVNLLSNDVNRFDLVSIFLHYMWAAPVAGAISAYFMYREVGWPAFVGIAAVFVVVPLQAYTGNLSAKFRHKTAVKTDERVRLMDEILSGIQVIKMYAWEKPFAALVAAARRAEIRVVTATSYIRGLFMTFGLCTTRIALFATMITMVLVEKRLTADKVFVVLSYFNILSQTMSMMFVRGVAEVAEALVSVRRLQDFMDHEEIGPTLQGVREENGAAAKGGVGGGGDGEAPPVHLDDVTARWDDSGSEPTLSHVNIRVPEGRLVTVIGHVGAGKSSLLQALLGELPAASGRVRVRGRVAYAAQEAWVFAATVRQNILFGRPYDRHRYEAVTRACALQRDFEQLPHGDLTVVGQRGAALSGGQKARINLARAVYTEADIYLLDDPLSAVDTHVGKHLFEECICGYLGNKTRILVTHQLQYLHEVDHIVVLNNGRVELQGDFAALAAQVDYATLLGAAGEETESGDLEDQPEAEQVPSTPIHALLRQISVKSRTSSISLDDATEATALVAAATEAMMLLCSMQSKASSTSSCDDMSEAAAAVAEEESERLEKAGAAHLEQSSKGRIGGKSVYAEYMRAGTSCTGGLFILALFLLSQSVVSTVDWFVSYWTTQEELRAMLADNGTLRETATEFAVVLTDALDGWPTAGDFNATSWPGLLAEKIEEPPLSSLNFVYVFTALIVLMFTITLTRSLCFYTGAMRASERLHAAMFDSISRARMRFFDTNPSGRILNRFSKDIGSVDELLPKAILDAGQIILLMVGCICVSVSANPFFIVPVVVLGIIFWYDRKIYLKTSKNVKRVEGITKSPVFTHLHATLQGLTTVRAAGAQATLIEEFDRHQDLHSSAWYMFMATSSAFGFSLDVMVFVYIAVVTFSFLLLGAGVLGGQVGLAITQSMALTGMIQWGMRQSAEVANNMMSVERVLEYSLLEPEPNLECPPGGKPPKGWPWAGEVRFEDVYLSYSEEDAPVLKGLSLVIKPSEKVGVVGRTGAGKSSLIAALFRLAWRIEGRVAVDGVDTAAVALQELRAKLSIIPQDPVLFSGTMRRNLDPFDEFPDYVLWKAIEEVELKDPLNDMQGLDTRVAEGGSNFSVGQRQLVCLARAILRNNRILVLDEATANVDPQTDALIQTTIRQKFEHCTVLTVAHRLNTIMDSDKVLVMSAGNMVEFDHPHILLQNKEGYFYSMVQETGPNMAQQLAQIAEECYHKKEEEVKPGKEEPVS